MRILKTNRIIVIVGFFFSILYSCKYNKTNQNQPIEIIQSKVMDYLFLVKNPPKKDSLLKKELINFLVKNPPKKENNAVVYFYRYTKYNDLMGMHNGTSHFIDNLPDPGGFSSEELSHYREDEIATYLITKCENDTTKFVGEFYFYKKLRTREIDTVLYKCR